MSDCDCAQIVNPSLLQSYYHIKFIQMHTIMWRLCNLASCERLAPNSKDVYHTIPEDQLVV